MNSLTKEEKRSFRFTNDNEQTDPTYSLIHIAALYSFVKRQESAKILLKNKPFLIQKVRGTNQEKHPIYTIVYITIRKKFKP